jgi:hypothetical protein
MAIEVRETTLATDGDATTVQLHIADAPVSDETAAFRLNLVVRLPRYKAPLVFQVQREAILRARDALEKIAVMHQYSKPWSAMVPQFFPSIQSSMKGSYGLSYDGYSLNPKNGESQRD